MSEANPGTSANGRGNQTGQDSLSREKAIETVRILKIFIGLSETQIIRNTFIEGFEHNARRAEINDYRFHGNFHPTGTVSGRMSSSKPNLQNTPSTGNQYAKDIKGCIRAPRGWVFCGADYNGLEDRISALTTKDKNKLKVFTDGFDGHSLRAHKYFPEQLGYLEETVEEINSISKNHPDLRQKSKPITFALTYRGTWRTLVKNCGLQPEEAKAIEANYHELYAESDAWVQSRLNQACIDGYVTLAFGLRLRTPLLKKIIPNSNYVPSSGEKEFRTAGNALGQSYGLLNNRASIDFRKRLLRSRFKHDIRPSCHIHDAQYFLVKSDPEVLCWFNNNLVECMQWQELPEIQHDQVKLEAEVAIYYPSWNNPIPLENKASLETIQQILKENEIPLN